MRGGLGLAGLLLAASISAQAATLHVPGQYSQIQFAVNAAQVGDTVLVAPGTYTYLHQPPGADSCAVAMKSGITLLGSGQGQTIIDPVRLSRAIYCSGVTNARIGRLTVKRAFAQIYGAGIYCKGGSSPTIFDCEVTDCGDGGIICNLGSSPTIDHCTITNNEAKEGGGVACEASSSPVVTYCTIRGNSAPSGGGVFAKSGSAPRFEHCVIEQNSLSTLNGSGGGVGVVFLLGGGLVSPPDTGAAGRAN
jgi:parallel beta-helix repeat protein